MRQNDQRPEYAGLVQPTMKNSVFILVTDQTHLQQNNLIGFYQNQEQLGTCGWSLSNLKARTCFGPLSL